MRPVSALMSPVEPLIPSSRCPVIDRSPWCERAHRGELCVVQQGLIAAHPTRLRVRGSNPDSQLQRLMSCQLDEPASALHPACFPYFPATPNFIFLSATVDRTEFHRTQNCKQEDQYGDKCDLPPFKNYLSINHRIDDQTLQPFLFPLVYVPLP